MIQEIAGKIDVNLLNLRFEAAVLAFVAPETGYDNVKMLGEYRDLSFVSFGESILVFLLLFRLSHRTFAGEGAKRKPVHCATPCWLTNDLARKGLTYGKNIVPLQFAPCTGARICLAGDLEAFKRSSIQKDFTFTPPTGGDYKGQRCFKYPRPVRPNP